MQKGRVNDADLMLFFMECKSQLKLALLHGLFSTLMDGLKRLLVLWRPSCRRDVGRDAVGESIAVVFGIGLMPAVEALKIIPHSRWKVLFGPLLKEPNVPRIDLNSSFKDICPRQVIR